MVEAQNFPPAGRFKERKAGELLAAMDLKAGRPSDNGNTVLPLSDLGISKMQSSRWQKEASVDEYAAELERIRKQANKGGRPPKEKLVQRIEPVSSKDNSKLTDHKIAEAIGTNRQKAKANQVAAGGNKALPQKSAEAQPIDTRQELAKAAGVSHDTVAKVKQINAAEKEAGGPRVVPRASAAAIGAISTQVAKLTM